MPQWTVKNAVVLSAVTSVSLFVLFIAHVGPTNPSMKLVKAGKYLSEPIDPHTYSYIHNPNMTCLHENGTKTGIYLLFIVPTAPGNFQRREAIRRSYGNARTWPIIDAAGTKTVFMLGTTTDNGVHARIDKEAGTYGDIVQEDFVDSYLNLTRKTVMGLKWATNYCHHALYVMKIDDDTTANQPRIVEIVKHAPRIKFSLGQVFRAAFVKRTTRSKFYLSKEYYPADKLPSYINGPSYIMSADIVESVYHTAVALPLFPWEDVFVGMCLQKLEVKLRHDKAFIYGGNPIRIAQRRSKCPEKNAIFTDLSKDYVWQIFDACRE